jgi:ribose transport system substrate-binding protein
MGSMALAATLSVAGASAQAPLTKQAKADAVLARAKAAVAAAEGPTTKWDGPTTGPKGQTGKRIVCLEYLGSDIVAQQWCGGAEAAAKALGWKVTILAADGSLPSEISVVNQAVALHPDGIVNASIDAVSAQSAFKSAASAGIKIVGINAAALQQPYPALHMFANLTDNGAGQAKLAADLAIANSNGNAQGIAVTDVTFAIAKLKADSFAAEIKRCSGCKVALYDNVPAGEATTRMAPQFTSYLQRFKGTIYAYAVNDFFFDVGISALSAAAVPNSGRIALIGSGGSAAAYQRIKKGRWEIGTVPLPLREQGWEAVDELNRAFAGTRWNNFSPALHIITKANIAKDLVKGQYFDPKNNYIGHYKKIWGVK